MPKRNGSPIKLLGFLLGSFTVFSPNCWATEKVNFRKNLTAYETQCLRELLDQSFPPFSADDQFVAEATVAQASLKGGGRNGFIFIVHDSGYCGTAGCMMLIGERRRDKRCHLLTDGDDGYDFRPLEVLNRRDHGYRRLYTPCEFRFDGKRYQQVRIECPNAVIHQ